MNRRGFLQSCGMAVMGLAGVGKVAEAKPVIEDVALFMQEAPNDRCYSWSIKRIANIERSPFPDFDEQRVIQICDEIDRRQEDMSFVKGYTQNACNLDMGLGGSNPAKVIESNSL